MKKKNMYMSSITKITSFLCLLCLSYAALAQEGGRYEIKGKLKQGRTNTERTIYLQHFIEPYPVDSTKMINGKFTFRGKCDTAHFANIYYSDAPGSFSEVLEFYIEPGQIHISGDLHALASAKVRGSDLNAQHIRFRRENKLLMDSLLTFTSNYVAAEEQLMKESFAMDSPTRDSLKKMEQILGRLSNRFVNQQAKFTKDNPHSELSLFFILDMLKNPANAERVMAIFDELRSYNIVSPLFAKVQREVAKLNSLRIGDQAPEFSLPDTTGKIINLRDFQGQYVLVDFWASWCVPCRVENEEVKKTYDAFKDKGFTVLGISSDINPDSWKKAIANDKLTWYNVLDMDNSVNELYHIKAIPSNFLLDPTGKIIAINLRGQELYNAVSNLK